MTRLAAPTLHAPTSLSAALHRRKKVKGPDGVVRQVSTVSSMAVSGSESSVADSVVDDLGAAGHVHAIHKFEDTDDDQSVPGEEHEGAST